MGLVAWPTLSACRPEENSMIELASLACSLTALCVSLISLAYVLGLK